MRSLCYLAALVVLFVPAAAAHPITTASSPFDVASASGKLFVLDQGGHIDVLDQSGRLLQTIASPGSGRGQLSSPSAFSIAKGKIYVADTGNHRVSVFSTVGRFLFSFGHYSTDTLPGVFYSPIAIAVGAKGYVYVADHHYMIQVFTPQGRFVRWWGHRRTDSLHGSWLYLVDALAVDHAGRVYAADRVEDRIRVFSAGGAPLGSYGPNLPGWHLDLPSGLAVAPDGTLYASDAFEHLATHNGDEKLLRFNSKGELLGMTGAPCGQCSPGVGSDALGSFYSPQGVAVAFGHVYVADSGNHRLQVLGLDGQPQAAWPISP
jgi:DNA-binding beta-propeller fold protein YncE